MIHARKDYERIQDPAGKIPADEPVMLFRSTDVLTPAILAKYADLLRLHHCDQRMIDSTLEQESRVRAYQRQHGCKLPDMPAEGKEETDRG